MASGGLEICVSSTNFQKDYIGWPQHKHEAEFKCLDDSKVLRGDFPGLKTSATSMTSVASVASMASTISTASIYQKITDPDGLIILSTQMINTNPFF